MGRENSPDRVENRTTFLGHQACNLVTIQIRRVQNTRLLPSYFTALKRNMCIVNAWPY